MYALVLIRYRRPIEDVLPSTPDHRSYLTTLHQQGILLASGPFDPRIGGALLLRLPDGEAASALDRIRDADPYWQRGLANYELLPWAPTIGLEGLDRL